jgi:hypothetical protein
MRLLVLAVVAFLSVGILIAGHVGEAKAVAEDFEGTWEVVKSVSGEKAS